MIGKIFNDQTITILRKALDAASLRHQVLSDNIANVNTPGFKRSDVVFQQELKNAINESSDDKQFPGLANTNPRHFTGITSNSIDDVMPKVIMQNDTVSRNDLNNVDIDLEMSKLAENTILYSALAQITSLRLNSLKSAINEGRK